MKRLLFFITLAILSVGFVNAQAPTKLNFTLDPTHDSGVNNKRAIPVLSKDAVWKITAKTLYMGEPSGSWGSRIFSAEREGAGEYSGFEFYLRPEDHSNNPGKLGLNNKYDFGDEAISIDHTNGTLFTFVVSCDGEGVITAVVTVNHHEWTATRDNVEYIDYVQAAQNYEVEVEVEYSPAFLSVTPETIDFGAVMIDAEPVEKEISIAGAIEYSDKYSYSITAEKGDVGNFIVSDEEFSEDTGGKLTVFLWPEIEVFGDHKAILTVKRGDETKTVELIGYVAPMVPVIISPAPGNPNADAEGNVWYRIQFNKRTGFCLTGNTAGVAAEASLYDADDDSQLWKFTSANENEYNMVNKAGNGLQYRYEEKDANGEVTVTGRFLIANGANDNTYTFDLRTDGGWQIKWNEYESEDSDGNMTYGSYINKTNTDNEFTAHSTIPDDGSSVVFYYENEVIDLGLPEFSTAANPIWYYIQFYRTAKERVGKENFRFQGTGVDEDIIQAEFDESLKETFFWRFEGTWDNFKIFNYEGDGFGEISTSATLLTTGDLAASMKFRRYSTTEDWEIQDINSGNFLNDHGGTIVGGWSSDAGCRLVMYKIEDDPSGIEDIPTNDKGEILTSVYYTIQGVQLNGIPTKSGVYIKKDIYVSGKTSAKTIFILNK